MVGPRFEDELDCIMNSSEALTLPWRRRKRRPALPPLRLSLSEEEGEGGGFSDFTTDGIAEPARGRLGDPPTGASDAEQSRHGGCFAGNYAEALSLSPSMGPERVGDARLPFTALHFRDGRSFPVTPRPVFRSD